MPYIVHEIAPRPRPAARCRQNVVREERVAQRLVNVRWRPGVGKELSIGVHATGKGVGEPVEGGDFEDALVLTHQQRTLRWEISHSRRAEDPLQSRRGTFRQPLTTGPYQLTTCLISLDLMKLTTPARQEDYSAAETRSSPASSQTPWRNPCRFS